MNKKFIAPVVAATLILCLSFIAVADTIRLKDGSVIRGQVIGFKDQQFTVMIGSGARGRRSRITLYMEDVEAIEFDSATNAAVSAIVNDDATTNDNRDPAVIQPSRTGTSPSDATSSRPSDTASSAPRSSTRPQPAPATSSPTFFQVNTRVRGDNIANGWTNTGLVVRRGQRLRINATGRVALGAGRFSTPAGLPTLPDKDKLMRNEATGALIAVIGDDNDDFIFIGRGREFIAQRDGVLFLGVNEGNLNDNTGAYDAVIEAEAVSNAQQR